MPTPSSANIKATNHTPTSVSKINESLHTTTLRVPWSKVSHETVVLTQRDKNVGETNVDHEPEHVPTRLVIVFSITAAFLVIVVVPSIMFLLFLVHRKQKR